MGKNDFFLEPDDAQTMGDINYMRMAKKVRRTFPKTLKNPDGFAVEKSVSSEEERDFSGVNQGFQTQSFSTSYSSAPAPSAESASTSSKESTPAPAPSRQPDTSMDMFRNMAKKIGKK